MYQLPAESWNLIADHYPTKTVWGEVMALDEEAMDAALTLEAKALREKGLQDLTTVAFLRVAPLLAEREAIEAAVKDDPELRAALPEIYSPAEALTIIRAEIRPLGLTESELKTVAKLLNKIP